MKIHILDMIKRTTGTGSTWDRVDQGKSSELALWIFSVIFQPNDHVLYAHVGQEKSGMYRLCDKYQVLCLTENFNHSLFTLVPCMHSYQVVRTSYLVQFRLFRIIL